MSIAVLIGVHEGLVIASDSASALTVSVAPGSVVGIANVYDNANKIFNLYKGRPIGCVTFGSGSIGNSSIGTLVKDLRAALSDKEKCKNLGIQFDPDNYTMEQVSKIVADFLAKECQKQTPASLLSMNIGLLLGGYSTNGSLGESWSIEIKPGGKATEPKQLRPPDQPGISWGGAADVLQRIILGYSPLLFQVLAEVSGPQQGHAPVSAQQLYDQLHGLLEAKLQAPLVFAPMPIQDAIDLGRFLVNTAIMYTRFLPGPPIVGGPVEIAAITKHEQFKWISRKHYFDQSLNQEPKHVFVDRSEED
ncbi:MAG: hypothetical protein NT090_01865 [Acidobacteria bacterium]|nr:hypothetical protein [Acidobacteriota bacterium]